VPSVASAPATAETAAVDVGMNAAEATPIVMATARDIVDFLMTDPHFAVACSCLDPGTMLRSACAFRERDFGQRRAKGYALWVHISWGIHCYPCMRSVISNFFVSLGAEE
jgi:hypothetical protein